MAGERAGHTLQATALVNEAYLRLIDVKQVEWQDRAHFLRWPRASCGASWWTPRARRATRSAAAARTKVSLDEALVVIGDARPGFRGARRCLERVGGGRPTEVQGGRDALLRRDERGGDGGGAASLASAPSSATGGWRRPGWRANWQAPDVTTPERWARIERAVSRGARARRGRARRRFWPTRARATTRCVRRSSRCWHTTAEPRS